MRRRPAELPLPADTPGPCTVEDWLEADEVPHDDDGHAAREAAEIVASRRHRRAVLAWLADHPEADPPSSRPTWRNPPPPFIYRKGRHA